MTKECGSDFLIMRNDEEFLGGYAGWFSGIPANDSYPFSVVFPLHEEMTLIACDEASPAESFYPPARAVHGVTQRFGAPSFPSLRYSCIGKRGCAPESRLFAHGQGYDLVERPAIRYDDPMTVQAGMNIAIHPFAANQNTRAPVTDNYLVTELGKCPCIHKFPREIIEV